MYMMDDVDVEGEERKMTDADVVDGGIGEVSVEGEREE